MIINRHNYEEFFLLYVDDELTPVERLAVEQFVQQNQDLKEELEMLKQAILPKDDILFHDKELLYNMTADISQHNYEEYFLLSVDEELTAQENEAVEKFVLKHPELQGEFTLLQQTRLEPETIIFAEKEKLYKKVEKEKPVIFLNWMRISAAAAVVVLISMTWLFYSTDRSVPVVSLAPVVEKQPIVKIDSSVPADLPSRSNNKALIAVQEKLAGKTVPLKVTKTKLKPELKVKTEVFASTERIKKPEQIIVDKASKTIEEPQKKKAFEEAIALAKITPGKNAAIIKEDASLAENTQPAATVLPASYKEIDTEENDEENTFYLGSAEINKNKLKGLFRKATSLLGKRNNDDGERTLKIAGFEIKSK